MNGPIRRLALTVLVGLGLVLGSATWFQVLGADRYRSDPRNARPAISRSVKERGVIVTGDGTILAESLPDEDDPRSFARRYPEGEAFAPVVGYTSLLVGDAGLEAAYADELRSRRDLTISDLIAVLLGRDLRPLSLQLTLDPELQRTAYEALAGRRGAVVALDPATGAVLALVSSPSFDPETLLGSDAVDRRRDLLDDPDQPLLDRATRSLYPPASTFKVLVAAAAFDAGVAGPESEYPDLTEFPLPGSTATIRNFTGRTCGDGTTVTVQTAFVRSCNTTFAALALDVGAEPLARTAEAAGFDRDLRFPWEVARSTFPLDLVRRDPAALAQSGIGERDVRATPLTMAMVAAAVANGGETMAPFLVRQVFDADGEAVDVTQPTTLGRAMSPATAAVLGGLMELVVTEGTGRRAAVPGLRVAGKTGTAASPEGPPHAWFIGFAPVERPRIAVAVLVESGGDVGESATGGTVAAPIARALFERFLATRS